LKFFAKDHFGDLGADDRIVGLLKCILGKYSLVMEIQIGLNWLREGPGGEIFTRQRRNFPITRNLLLTQNINLSIREGFVSWLND
jgi:hypothetical protein